MTATIIPTSNTTTTIDSSRPRLWRAGAAAGLCAAVATSAVAAGAVGVGVSLEADGEAFPIAGFAQMTLLFTVVGVLIARGIARRARRPQHTWIRTTVVLTALSFLPDLMVPADVPTKLTLMLTHVVAAVIVVPALAARLPHDAR